MKKFLRIVAVIGVALIGLFIFMLVTQSSLMTRPTALALEISSSTFCPSPTTNVLDAQASTLVTATRITNRSAPFIDGALEDIWQHAGRLVFPNRSGGLIASQNYTFTDPTTFTVYYLHDDINLYIAVETTNDMMVEGADYDQSSDGLAGMAIARKNGLGELYSMFRLMWYTDTITSTVYGPPIDRNGMVYTAEWRSVFTGTWNVNSDSDSGYVFEFFIPLGDVVSRTPGLGGWAAGESITTNIVLVDHDSNPGAAFNDPQVDFRKCWWGSHHAPEDLSEPRWIHLSDRSPIGTPGDNITITARRIVSIAAPIIDGVPDDLIWQQAYTYQLRFPNSVGWSFTPGPSQAAYNTDDPSSYTVTFLHDDTYLYVSVKSDDQKIESAAYDQASDGLISLVLETKSGGSDRRYATFWHELDISETHDLTPPITDCDGTTLYSATLYFREGPPRYPYITPHITWGPIIIGTWNYSSDVDAGYAFEYKIPLTQVQGLTKTLGGYVAGDLIPANIVFVDHDNYPGGVYTDVNTHFKKFWWGFDGNEFYPPDQDGAPGSRRIIPSELERYIWLDNSEPYSSSAPSRDPVEKAIEYITNSQLEYSGLLRSYQGEMAAHTYDNAVALIALTDAGKRAEAEKLVNALISVLEITGTEGFFYDSYNVVDKIVGQGTASGTGPNTWAAYALAYYGKAYCDQDALAAADKVARWVINNLYDATTGGVSGGICHPFEERTEDNHSNDVIFPFTSTEQVIDTWHLFRMLGYTSETIQVQSWLTSARRGWIDTDPREGNLCRQDNRFATGVNDKCGPDRRLYLDPQSWGSIVANMIGEYGKADGAIAAAETHMLAITTVNGIEISGFRDSCLPKDDVIWYGGTAQMIVAYVYDGNTISASHFLTQMLEVQNDDGSWNHSSADNQKIEGEGCDQYESFHSVKPHIGETAWNYFALRDVNDGRKLPYATITTTCYNYLPIILRNASFDDDVILRMRGEPLDCRISHRAYGHVEADGAVMLASQRRSFRAAALVE